MAGTFVGRSAELGSIEDRFASARLVTLLGMGGVGKSRLAREYAARHGVETFVFCDLSAAQTVEDVCTAVGAALQIGLDVVGPPSVRVEALGRALATRTAARGCVLVLDAVETVATDLTPLVETWLESAKQAHILVTSRVRLGADDEQVLPIEPFPTEEGKSAEAERMFVERAEASGGTVTDADRPSVRAILRALEGIPLAIELVAARARLLPVATLLARVLEGQDLAGHDGDEPRRHGTMRNVVAGSWALLDPSMQEALAACACFRGGFSVESAEVMLAPSAASAPKALDVLTRLADASLLRTTPTSDGTARFDLFQTVRSYAAERMAERPELERALFRKHAEHMAGAARAWRDAAPKTGGVVYLVTLARDHDNLVVALTRMLAQAERAPLDMDGARLLLQLVVELEPIRALRGHASTYVAWLRAALGATSADEFAAPLRALRLHAVLCEARALSELGVVAESRAAFERARELAAASDDGSAEGYARAGLARLDAHAGEWQRALGEFAEVKVCAIRAKDDGLKHLALASESFHGSELRDAEEHLNPLERAATHFRGAGDERESLFWMVQLGRAYTDFGRLDRAHARLSDGLARARAIGDRRNEGFASFGLGGVHLSRGELDEAIATYQNAADILAEVGKERDRGYALGYLGVALQLSKRYEEAEAAYAAGRAAFAAVGDEPNVVLFSLFEAGLSADRDRTNESAVRLEHARTAARRWAGNGMRLVVAEMMNVLLETSRARAALDHEGLEEVANHFRAAERGLRHAEATPEHIESASEVYDWRDVSLDVRIAYRLGKRALESFPTLRLPAESVLILGECLRIRPSADREWIDLAGRVVLRRVLTQLVDARLTAPGTVVPAAKLIANGWPGERMTERSAANRLHVTLGMLRRLGLRDLLEHVPGGWRLRTEIPMMRVNEGDAFARGGDDKTRAP